MKIKKYILTVQTLDGLNVVVRKLEVWVKSLVVWSHERASDNSHVIGYR